VAIRVLPLQGGHKRQLQEFALVFELQGFAPVVVLETLSASFRNCRRNQSICWP
jgi:hypothetical protein